MTLPVQCELAQWMCPLCTPACTQVLYLPQLGEIPFVLIGPVVALPTWQTSPLTACTPWLGAQVDLEYLLNAAGSLPAPPQLRTADVDSVSTYLEGLAMSQQPASDPPASAGTPATPEPTPAHPAMVSSIAARSFPCCVAHRWLLPACERPCV